MKNKIFAVSITLFAVLLTLVFVGSIVRKADTNSSQKNEDVLESNSEENTQNKAEEKQSENKSGISNKSESPVLAPVPVESASVGDVTQPLSANRVSFVAVGDIIVHSTVLADSRDLAVGTGKEFNFLPMFSNVADIIKNADLAYVNQESPYGGPDRAYTGYPMFSTPDQEGYDLMSLGFDIINLANNHMLDAGTKGYKRTIDFWKKQENVTYIGGYTDKADYENIRVIEKDGIKIALLSYTYGTNGLSLTAGSEMVIPLCDESGNDDIDRMTKKAREMADIVMVSMHWGNEDWFEPSALQKKQVEIMVNNGVDVIIGTHPHVLEPMMWKERPDGGKTLVIYSLGNFLSGMLYIRNHVGGIAGFDIVKVGDAAFIDAPYFIPTVCHQNVSWRKFKIYRFSEYTQELLSAHRCQNISDPGRSLEYMRKIIDDSIPQEFLIEDFYKAS